MRFASKGCLAMAVPWRHWPCGAASRGRASRVTGRRVSGDACATSTWKRGRKASPPGSRLAADANSSGSCKRWSSRTPARAAPRAADGALYRSGRQADALEAYRQTRSLFDRELGIEPSPQCASSNVRSSPTTATSLHRRKTGSGAGCLSPCLRSSWPPWPGHLRRRFAISEIDTTSARVTRTVRLDRTPAGIAANPKDVWVSVD